MMLEMLLIVCGVYVLVQNIKMKTSGEISKGMVNPKINLESAPDVKGYIKYMYIRGICFGILLIAFSLLMIGIRFVEYVPQWFVLLIEVIYIAGLIYYAAISVKAQNRFLFRHSANKDALKGKKSKNKKSDVDEEIIKND